MLVKLFCGIIFVVYGIRTVAMGNQRKLSVDFYKASCPAVENVVFDTMTKLAMQSNVVPPSTLRMFFHDCFIEGCDASIMISSTERMKAERELPENNIAQNAFEGIVEVKKAVERVCPGVVSCADIIAMAARDAVTLLGGPKWDVLKGRLDGFVSSAARGMEKVPGADSNTTQLIQTFAARNLSVLDMVVLSGAHTVGFSHCNQFTNRLYNFAGEMKSDPSLNSSFASALEEACPKGGDPNRFQPFDKATPFVFDNHYFKNLQTGEGLLFSDQDLLNNNLTAEVVRKLVISSQEFFFSQFVVSMVKLGNVGVKTDFSVGNIRSDCTAFNT